METKIIPRVPSEGPEPNSSKQSTYESRDSHEMHKPLQSTQTLRPPQPVSAAEQTTTQPSHVTTQEHPASAQLAQPEPAQQKPTNSPGVVIMQWLSYAFWGWLIIALIWLMSVILMNAILGSDVHTVVPYAIAAGSVLLPIAFFCDFFYRKYEPAKKAGAAMVIMVIHAVIFALLGIGALITAVFTGVNASLATTSSFDVHLVTILTALLATGLYTGAFIRTLNPFKGNKVSLTYGITMLILTLILIGLSIAGPLAKSYATRSDRLTNETLQSVESAISRYVNLNGTLPKDIKSLDYPQPDTIDAINQSNIEYINEGKVKANSSSSSRSVYRYQLCATYKHDSPDSSYSRPSYPRDSDYSTYLSTNDYKAGRNCYKLETSSYDY